MNSRRLTNGGVALVAAFTFGLAGCSSDGSTDGSAGPTAGATSAASQVEAREELAAAVEKLDDDTAKVTFTTAGFSGSGAIDRTGQKTRFTGETSVGSQVMKINMMALGRDVYLKVDGLPMASDKWMHLDATRLGAGNLLRRISSGDPIGANNLLKDVADVQRVDQHNFKGTIDFTKAPNADQQVLQALGDNAKAIPFTARTDEQGRLTELTVDLQSIQPGLGPFKSTYSDFGAPVDVEKPAASEVEEATDDVLRMFGA
jgi:hypothetical protein